MATSLALFWAINCLSICPSLQGPEVCDVLMAEVAAEATYVAHHPKKIALIFSAMRHFAVSLEQRGYRVHYHRYDPNGFKSLHEALQHYQSQYDRILITRCGEYRLQSEMESWSGPIEFFEDTRFLCPLDDFNRWAQGRKQLRMEFFYREMRKRYQLLMEGPEPTGGQWNFDADNREKYQGEVSIGPLRFETDAMTREVLSVVGEHFGHHFGELEPFWFGVAQEQAEAAFAHFIEHQLADFGRYQDAMRQDDDWLFHSCISVYLNLGLLNFGLMPPC